MGNNVQVFNNKELGLQVRTLPNPDGSISISAEDTAIGFGWCRTEKRNGKEYTSIRWERMNGFSEECGFAHKWAKDDYIPESLFYRLGMKASNPAAEKNFKTGLRWMLFRLSERRAPMKCQRRNLPTKKNSHQ